MKIISWNVNGHRSVYGKGFIDWFYKENPDLLCLQEIKADEDQLPFDLRYPKGYRVFFNSAYKKGYAGTAVYSKKEPLSVKKIMDFKTFDTEGRILELEFHEFILMNLYIPHGGRGKEKLFYKLSVYNALLNKLKKIRDKQVILAGDFNIAHEEIDLAKPKDNINNVMFTPIERKQIDDLINQGFIDTFRYFNKGGGNYTWWPYMKAAREKNLGWRIDYIFITKGLESNLKSAFILDKIKMSDHCPIGINLD